MRKSTIVVTALFPPLAAFGQDEPSEQKAQAREEATAEELENFRKAFSVCLEAKDYMVKC